MILGQGSRAARCLLQAPCKGRTRSRRALWSPAVRTCSKGTMGMRSISTRSVIQIIIINMLTHERNERYTLRWSPAAQICSKGDYGAEINDHEVNHNHNRYNHNHHHEHIDNDNDNEHAYAGQLNSSTHLGALIRIVVRAYTL
jgi:hypothetical protein